MQNKQILLEKIYRLALNDKWTEAQELLADDFSRFSSNLIEILSRKNEDRLTDFINGYCFAKFGE